MKKEGLLTGSPFSYSCDSSLPYNPHMAIEIPSITEISWPFRIFAILFVAQFIPRLWRAYRRRVAETWPITSGRIETAIMEDKKNSFSFTRNKNEHFEAELIYSYAIGELFAGRYKRT